MGRNLIAGDIHGQYGLLMEALEKASFDPVSDTLYFTGDLADRGSGSALVIRFLMSLPSCHGVLGNHDIWLENYLLDDAMPSIWLDMNGGKMTVASYMENRISSEEKALHGLWLRNIPLCIHTSKYIITHAGIPLGFDEDDIIMTTQSLRKRGASMSVREKDFMWDRGYITSAMHFAQTCRIHNHDRLPMSTEKRIFVGHTPLSEPFVSERYRLVAVDTGAGHTGGHLTVMDMDTLEYWESSRVL